MTYLSPDNGTGHPEPYRVTPRTMPDIQPSDHEAMKDELRPGLKRYCQKLLEGVEAGERTAMYTYPRIMGAIGAEVEIKVGILLQKELGVGSMEEARRKLSMVTSVEGIDPDSAVSVMEQHVRAWYHARGKRVLVVDDSAEVATNGQA